MAQTYSTLHLESVDSTSRYLKDYVAEHRPTSPLFCVTEQQTHGYGQQQRSWLTNQHSAIFSLAYPILPKRPIQGVLSLNIAALLHQSLSELTADTLYLKWPNDLYNDNGKVAGILIEQVLKKDYQALIIGIGINRGESQLIEGASAVTPFETEQLLDTLFNKLQQSGLMDFSTEALLDYWQAHDLFASEEPIKLITAEKSDQAQNAVYLGINATGQAQIRINDQIQLLSSGQTSIRKRN